MGILEICREINLFPDSHPFSGYRVQKTRLEAKKGWKDSPPLNLVSVAGAGLAPCRIAAYGF
jgi:hypothetical protein